MATAKFSSEGFDLDAAGDGGDDVVLEIGGGVTVLDIHSKDENKNANNPNEEDKEEDDPMKEAEDYKQQGNKAFIARNWTRAQELYTKAIESTPGITAEELFELQQAWRQEQDQKWREKLQRDEEERRREHAKKREINKDKDSTSTDTSNNNESTGSSVKNQQQQQQETKQEERAVFEAPPHPHGEKLSVYHCNRAAVLLHLTEYEQAIRDCDAALLWNPTYVKAYSRRSTAYEQLDKTDMALADAKEALAWHKKSSSNIHTASARSNTAKLQATVTRLQKIEDERLEKLKSETMDKLKDLGNSILGNFGLSLDNFNAVQDPNTGSYSINFSNK